MKRLSIALAVIIALIGLGGTAWFTNMNALAQQEDAGAPPTEAAVAVPMQVVQAGDGLAARSFIGRVEAQRTVDIAFQIGGQIVEIGPTEGERVAAGTLPPRWTT